MQCSAKKLASEPCACFGGSARIAGVFEYIRSAYNATDTAADLTAAIDVGGNFFGSGLYYPWDKGETSVRKVPRPCMSGSTQQRMVGPSAWSRVIAQSRPAPGSGCFDTHHY